MFAVRFQTEPVARLVLGVEDHSLGVGDSADMVLVVGGGQPHPGGELVIEQRQLGDQPLRLLFFGRQRGQTFPDPEQGLDKIPLRTKTLRLQTDTKLELFKGFIYVFTPPRVFGFVCIKVSQHFKVSVTRISMKYKA